MESDANNVHSDFHSDFYSDFYSDFGVAEPALAVRLFGGFELRLAGVPVNELRVVKDRWLLALLLLAHGRPVERSLLAARLWPFPDFDSGRAAANLRRGLWTLRRTLGSEAWRLQCPAPDTLIFDLTNVWVDVIAFDVAIDVAIKDGSSTALEYAIRLHRAPLLQVCTDIWIEHERDLRIQQCRKAREALLSMETPTESLAASGPSIYVHTDIQTDIGSALVACAVAQQPTDSDRETESSRMIHLNPSVSGCVNRSEPEGGAVPLDSLFYIVRPTDEAFQTAIRRRDSIVLVKGAREIGKTSLLARGLQIAREASVRVVLTDLQTLTAEQMSSADNLFLTLAESITDQLQLDLKPEAIWNPNRGWNVNFERFLRRDVLGQLEVPLVWALDEVERLFGHPFSTEVFAQFRSWHNQRALNPTGPWGRFTLAIAYATEAHLFIPDLNQSPFNVGTRLTLEDFTFDQVAELNLRYGSPLRDLSELERFYAQVGGHPALVRRGLQEMQARRMDIAAFEIEADREDGLFGNHLRRMLSALQQDSELCAALTHLLQGQPLPPGESFYRLSSAGLVHGTSAENARLRCQIYWRYLARNLEKQFVEKQLVKSKHLL